MKNVLLSNTVCSRTNRARQLMQTFFRGADL